MVVSWNEKKKCQYENAFKKHGKCFIGDNRNLNSTVWMVPCGTQLCTINPIPVLLILTGHVNKSTNTCLRDHFIPFQSLHHNGQEWRAGRRCSGQDWRHSPAWNCWKKKNNISEINVKVITIGSFIPKWKMQKMAVCRPQDWSAMQDRVSS